MTQSVKRGGTRWRKCVVALILPLLAIGAMAALTLTGQTPLNLAITGQDFKIASRDGSQVLAAEGATAYADLVEMKDGTIEPALKARIGAAEMSDGVCVSLVVTFPWVGSFTFALPTTGKTRLTDVTAYVDLVAAKNAELYAETSDGKKPAPDMSNVTRGLIANQDAAEVGLEGGRPGSLGLEIPGVVRSGSLQVGGKGAHIKGTLAISGIGLPSLSHGRGAGHGECF